jgi:phosphatidylglycerol:prolipoprotein diacylglycerol transferase
MLPVLHIGPAAIQTSGLILLAAIWLGLTLVERKSQKFGFTPAIAGNLAIIWLVAMLLGGRIVYAVEHLPAFVQSPASLVSLNFSLWDLPGGVFIGLAAGSWYGARHKVRFWIMLDALTPGFAVVLVAMGLANLASGNAYGEPAHLPWSIYLWGQWRQPTQVYEILGAVLIFFFKVFLPLNRNPQNDQSKGEGVFFLEFAAWSAAVQLFVGAFLADGNLIAGQFRAIQVGAWIVLAACLALLWRRKKQAGEL